MDFTIIQRPIAGEVEVQCPRYLRDVAKIVQSDLCWREVTALDPGQHRLARGHTLPRGECHSLAVRLIQHYHSDRQCAGYVRPPFEAEREQRVVNEHIVDPGIVIVQYQVDTPAIHARPIVESDIHVVRWAAVVKDDDARIPRSRPLPAHLRSNGLTPSLRGTVDHHINGRVRLVQNFGTACQWLVGFDNSRTGENPRHQV